MSDDADATTTLDYAARVPPDVRTSRLAVVALVAAVLGSPCVTSALSHRIGVYAPRQAERWVVVSALAFATVLSLVAVFRIRRSRGRLLGSFIASTALLLSLTWWALPAGVLLIFWMSGDRWLQ